MSNRQITIIRIVIHIAALLPLAVLLWDFTQGNLTANPIREIQLRTGALAINLLMLSLACTPVYILTGYKPVLLLRRPLGIYAFAYALLHFINFIGIDYSFNFALIREDLFEKRYAVMGFASFILLLLLAITSIKRFRQRLGKNWQRLHWLVYLAATIAIVHYIWLTRVDISLPLIYGGVLVILLAIRLPLARNFATRHFKWLNRTTP
ncbi:MAG: sulfoxide reductase heme-binding subunit YedZ [Chloroflexi bacterium]|nr:sulfoxide reductase heme-binding subunit YedZ [Chloroflexota bacterium]